MFHPLGWRSARLFVSLPKIGLLQPKTLGADIDLSPVIFLAGVIGLGAVATHSGLGAFIAEKLLAVVELEPGADQRNYSLAGVGWKRDRAHHHDACATVNYGTNGGSHGFSVGMVAYERVHGTRSYLVNVPVFLPGAACRSCRGTGRSPDILGY